MSERLRSIITKLYRNNHQTDEIHGLITLVTKPGSIWRYSPNERQHWQEASSKFWHAFKTGDQSCKRQVCEKISALPGTKQAILLEMVWHEAKAPEGNDIDPMYEQLYRDLAATICRTNSEQFAEFQFYLHSTRELPPSLYTQHIVPLLPKPDMPDEK